MTERELCRHAEQDPDGLPPIPRALLQAIPVFLGLKPDGARAEEIAAAFKGWDPAIDENLIAAPLHCLVKVPAIIRIAKPADDDTDAEQIKPVWKGDPGVKELWWKGVGDLLTPEQLCRSRRCSYSSTVSSLQWALLYRAA